MVLPASGSITVAQIAAEMGVSLPLDITSTAVRNFIGKPTGNVVLPNDFWGKSAVNLTPTAIDWPNVYHSFSSYKGSSNIPNYTYTASRTIAGLSSGQSISILLNVSATVTGDAHTTSAAFVYPRKNGTGVSNVSRVVNSNGVVANNTTTFTVTNGDTLDFQCGLNVQLASRFAVYMYCEVDLTVQVLNASSGNALIDTFYFNGYASDSFDDGGGGGIIV